MHHGFPQTAWTGQSLRVLLICALLASSARAADAAREKTVVRETLPQGLDQAIDRGLFFLQRQQRPNGSFEAEGPANAMSGLAILAFLAAGHTPDVGKYGLTVRNAIDYLVDQRPDRGYYGTDGGRMYSHCIVTIALSEVYGCETDEAQRRKVRLALSRALRVILEAQDVRKDPKAVGGWRYEPNSPQSDLSVSAWCMVSLRACQDAGLVVPKDRVDRALAYLMRCYRPAQRGFAYSPDEQDQVSTAMTAAALLNLHLLDAADWPETELAARYILEKPVRDAPYYYYTMYYATQGAFQAGGRTWAVVWKNTHEQLLPAQRRDDGSWPPRKNEPGGNERPGRFYATAMSCLTLSVPLRLLPMYQR